MCSWIHNVTFFFATMKIYCLQHRKRLWFNPSLALPKNTSGLAAVFLPVHLAPLPGLSCGPDGTFSALWAAATEAWLHCEVRGCSGPTGEGRKHRERWMGGRERWGGQIGLGDKGTMATRVPSRLVVEWPLHASLEPGPPSAPPQHTAGSRRWDGEVRAADYAIPRQL